MKKTIQVVLCVVMILAFSAGLWSCTNAPEEPAPGTQAENSTPPETQPETENEPETRVVTDIAGRTVTVPANPQKVATMPGPTYEIVFMLGAKDQVGLVREDHATAYPLALLTNPDLANYNTIANVGPQTPVNIEEFISKGVDLVIYYNIPQELEKFDKGSSRSGRFNVSLGGDINVGSSNYCPCWVTFSPQGQHIGMARCVSQS